MERYGVWVENADYERMINDIQRGKACFLGRESNSRTHWMVDLYLIAVYDNKRRSIATFLPPEAIDNYIPIGSFDPKNFKMRVED